MTAGVIIGIIALALILFILARSVRIVPQARAAVIERLGRYLRTATPGLTVLVPFIDRMRPMIDLREQVVSFPPQPVITADNLTVGVDSVIYFQVTDPRAATYEIANYIQAVEQLTITTLRNVIGSLNLEQALTSRDEINSKLRGVLDEATGPWGMRVARVEIKAIDPPPSIQDAMEQQMRADRNKRAIILTAEGQRESAIKTAEGQKAAAILDAEGRKQAAILAAEAERQSRILKAEGDRAAQYLAAQGQAKAIETTFGAIHTARPDPALLAYQYLQTLPKIAQGDANKVWVVPSEFSQALEGLAKLTGGDKKPSWLDAVGDGGEQEPIDTGDWFDSNLPPAAEQPEAANLRASDDDADSRAALEGIAPTSEPVSEILRRAVPTRNDPPPAAEPPADQPEPVPAAAGASGFGPSTQHPGRPEQPIGPAPDGTGPDGTGADGPPDYPPQQYPGTGGGYQEPQPYPSVPYPGQAQPGAPEPGQSQSGAPQPGQQPPQPYPGYGQLPQSQPHPYNGEPDYPLPPQQPPGAPQPPPR